MENQLAIGQEIKRGQKRCPIRLVEKLPDGKWKALLVAGSRDRHIEASEAQIEEWAADAHVDKIIGEVVTRKGDPSRRGSRFMPSHMEAKEE